MNHRMSRNFSATKILPAGRSPQSNPARIIGNSQRGAAESRDNKFNSLKRQVNDCSRTMTICRSYLQIKELCKRSREYGSRLNKHIGGGGGGGGIPKVLYGEAPPGG